MSGKHRIINVVSSAAFHPLGVQLAGCTTNG